MANQDLLSGLTNDALRDIARNEGSPKEAKLDAVKELLLRRSRHAKHDDLRHLVVEIHKVENPEPCDPPDPESEFVPRDEDGNPIVPGSPETPDGAGENIVPSDKDDFEFEEKADELLKEIFKEIDEEGLVQPADAAGPLKASVTTESLHADDVI